MKARKLLFYVGFCLCLSLPWLSACGDCEDCQPVFNAPYLRIRFAATDSISSLSSLITTINAGLDTLETTSATYDSLDSVNTELASRRTLLQSNRTRIDTVWAVGSTQTYLPTDTAEFHRIPLNPAADSTAFTISVVNTRIDLTVRYQLKTMLYEDQLVYLADSLTVSSSSFPDNTTLFCPTGACISPEARMTINITQ